MERPEQAKLGRRAVMTSSETPESRFSGLTIALAIAGVQLLLHVVTNGTYGVFRDELYYLDCARHLDWGYVDQPPLSIWLLAATRALFGESVHAIRLLSQLAGAGLVVIAALIAREMNGGRLAQGVAAIAAAVAPGALVLSGFFSMNAFDLIVWALLAWILVRIVIRDDPRLWLWFGLVAGIGLFNKTSVLFLGFGIAVAIVLTPLRRHLKSWQLWVGGAVALLFLVPYALWNAAHDWPTLEFMANAKKYKIARMTPLEFFGEQVMANSPPLAPVWLTGLVWLFLPRGGARYKALGTAFVAIFALMVALKVKPYYLFPAFAVLFAAGGCAVEQLVGRLRRPGARAAATLFVLFWVVSAGLMTLPLSIPILGPDGFLAYQAKLGMGPKHYENNPVGAMPQYFSDRFGWPNMAAVVASVWETMPEADRERAVILASNYGEAGAINYYGRTLGLPRAYSTHNNHHLWGPPEAEPEIFVYIGRHREEHDELFESVEEVARVHSTYGMPYESDLPILILRGLKRPLAEVWPEVKSFI